MYWCSAVACYKTLGHLSYEMMQEGVCYSLDKMGILKMAPCGMVGGCDYLQGGGSLCCSAYGPMWLHDNLHTNIMDERSIHIYYRDINHDTRWFMVFIALHPHSKSKSSKPNKGCLEIFPPLHVSVGTEAEIHICCNNARFTGNDTHSE